MAAVLGGPDKHQREEHEMEDEQGGRAKLTQRYRHGNRVTVGLSSSRVGGADDARPQRGGAKGRSQRRLSLTGLHLHTWQETGSDTQTTG